MKIIIVGKGGREHALARALHDAPSRPELYAYPGNDGMAALGQRVTVADSDALIDWMRERDIDLCVIGEETYLAAGLADRCRAAAIRVWGPVQAAARLESDKAFAKDFMLKHGIPTGRCTVATTPEALRAAVERYPCVLKYAGLAAGKGVSICHTAEEVDAFIEKVFIERAFGEGEVLVEEFLEGKELSLICAAADGAYQPFPSARDYKRQLDNDEGPNTGGMGVVASVSLIDEAILSCVEEEIVKPAVQGLTRDGLSYRGFLYFGLMLTPDGPKVLEFNCRFGDPEAQAILPLIRGDVAGYLYEAAAGTLRAEKLDIEEAWSVCVVLAARDYPYASGHGEVISGLDDLGEGRVYHAGTAQDDQGQFIVNGGRVLSVVCRGKDLNEARSRVYGEIKKVTFAGAQYRSDIGRLHFETGNGDK